MALFKVYRGELDGFTETFTNPGDVAFHDGYAYFVGNEGYFYIDYYVNDVASDSNPDNRRRKKVNAGVADGLLTPNGHITINDFLVYDEADEVYKVPIEHGGTDATTAEGARDNLEVYSITEVNAKVDAASATVIKDEENNDIVLQAAGWVNDSVYEGWFKYTCNLPTITCGQSHNVPPLIAFNAVTPRTDAVGYEDEWKQYSKIDNADVTLNANNVGGQLVLRTKEKPTRDIGIIVIDNR